MSSAIAETWIIFAMIKNLTTLILIRFYHKTRFGKIIHLYSISDKSIEFRVKRLKFTERISLNETDL